MKLTTKASYGVRALVNLAICYNKKSLSINQISKEEDISSIYLEQIFNILKKGKLVKSIRGPKGGYILARNPENINMYEIVEILEGGFSHYKCTQGKKNEKIVCKKAKNCVSKEVWDIVAKEVKKALEKIKLSMLAKRAETIIPSKIERINNL